MLANMVWMSQTHTQETIKREKKTEEFSKVPKFEDESSVRKREQRLQKDSNMLHP